MTKQIVAAESLEGMGTMVLKGLVVFGAGVAFGRYVVPSKAAPQSSFSGSKEYRTGFEETYAWMNTYLNAASSANLADYGLTTGRGEDYDLGRHEAWVEWWDAQGWPSTVTQDKAFQAGRSEVTAWLQQYPGASSRLPEYGSVTGRGEFYDAGRRRGWTQYWQTRGVDLGPAMLYPVYGPGY